MGMISVLKSLWERGGVWQGWRNALGRWVAGGHLKLGPKHCVAYETVRCVPFDLIVGFLK